VDVLFEAGTNGIGHGALQCIVRVSSQSDLPKRVTTAVLQADIRILNLPSTTQKG
jgi:hypothetical protein